MPFDLSIILKIFPEEKQFPVGLLGELRKMSFGFWLRIVFRTLSRSTSKDLSRGTAIPFSPRACEMIPYMEKVGTGYSTGPPKVVMSEEISSSEPFPWRRFLAGTPK